MKYSANQNDECISGMVDFTKVLLSFLTLCLIHTTTMAQDDISYIDIRGFNYGRLKIALEIEDQPATHSVRLSRMIDLLERNLRWSGMFDIHNVYENIDVLLKLRFIPNREIRVWIYTPDESLLFDHRQAIDEENDFQMASIKMVEEIIFQLTGEKSILRSAIAYIERDTTNRYRLLLTDAFGEKRVVLIDNNQYTILPRWKPDASAILYTTLNDEGSFLNLYLMNTRQIVTLFRKFDKLSGGTWTETGKELVLTRSVDGNSDLIKVDLDGNLIKRMTFRSSTEANPRLSPDGKRLLFVSNRSGSVQIYQRILKTGETFRMTFEGSYNYEPNWSNDGAYIVFSGLTDGKYQIFLMDREGNFVQQVTREDRSAEQPVWAPNGRQILFVSKVNYDQKLFIIRADGTFQRRLTKSGPGINEFNPTWSANYQWPKE